MNPAKLGNAAAEVLNRISEIDSKLLKEQRLSKDGSWYHPRDHWWDLSESETGDVPCKEQMPAPPRSLQAIDKSKYSMQDYLHNGHLIEETKTDAYAQYYKVKFEHMCEKQAVDLYHDYLTRVKSEYEMKNKRMAKDTKFSNFDQ